MPSHASASASATTHALYQMIERHAPAILERGSPDHRKDQGCEPPAGLVTYTPDLGEHTCRIRLFISAADMQQRMRDHDERGSEVVDVPTGLRLRIQRANCGAGCRCAARVTAIEPASATGTEPFVAAA